MERTKREEDEIKLIFYLRRIDFELDIEKDKNFDYINALLEDGEIGLETLIQVINSQMYNKVKICIRLAFYFLQHQKINVAYNLLYLANLYV